MIFSKNRYGYQRWVALAGLTSWLLFAISGTIYAQEPPPRPVVVTVTQNLGFGAFAQGAGGGTVTINTAGGRSSTGDVVPLPLAGYPFSAATFRLVGNAGTVISLVNGPDVSLPGSNGGSMTLHIGGSNPASPFILMNSPPGFTLMNVGATLTVGNPVSNPPGNYSGSFYITFMQE